MSINVYLKDAVQQIEGFKSVPYKDGSGENTSLSGLHIFNDNGRYYTTLCGTTASVPAVFVNIVEEVSLHEWIPCNPHREAGIYRYESAEGELNPDTIMKQNVTKVQIRAKKMEDLRKLFHMIRVGSIRPEESYEGPQGGMSRPELEVKLIELQRMKRRDDAYMASAETLKMELRRLHKALATGGWPFCRKEKVAGAISEILSSFHD